MARRGGDRRNGTKTGRRDVAYLRQFYDAGRVEGLRAGWIRGFILGLVVASGVWVGLLLALGRL